MTTLTSRVRRYTLRQIALRMHRKPLHLANAHPLVSFTFDDVAESGARNGAAVLEARGLRGTFFVASGLIGREENGKPILSEADVMRLAAHGHEIGCHTHAHASVAALDADALLTDLRRNAARLAALVPGVSLENFAYPFGLVSPAAKPLLAKRFATARSVMKGVNAGRVDAMMLRGVDLIDHLETPASVESWVSAAVEQTGWLIFILHDVDEAPTQFGCRPALLAHAVDAALKAGCQVVPVREALALAQTRTMRAVA
jgi:peptidoglycan/xylan/chitin deacetylase (PgdA/CDA1 family)